MDDDSFLLYVAGRLAGLPGVDAVTLGGSRAEGTQRPDSDWDFSVYYRGRFDPQALRDIGWPGEVFEVGGWGGGVFNGGAWLEIDGRKSDVHYRDLDIVDREIADSREGQFDIDPLMFHLAGVPSYLVLAEFAARRVLHGASAPARVPGRAAGTGAADLVGPGRADVRLRSREPRPVRSSDPVRRARRAGDVTGGARGPGRARRVDHQRETAAHPRGPWLRSMTFSPSRGRTPPSCATSSTDPGPSARTRCGQFIPCESYAGDISFCTDINSNNANYLCTELVRLLCCGDCEQASRSTSSFLELFMRRLPLIAAVYTASAALAACQPLPRPRRPP